MSLFDKIYKTALVSVKENANPSTENDYSNKFLSIFSALPENERDNFLAALTNYNANAKSNLKSTVDPTQAASLKGFLDKYHTQSDTPETTEDDKETETDSTKNTMASNLTPSNIVV